MDKTKWKRSLNRVSWVIWSASVFIHTSSAGDTPYRLEQRDFVPGHVRTAPWSIQPGSIGYYVGGDRTDLKPGTPVKVRSVEGENLIVETSPYANSPQVQIHRTELALGKRAIRDFDGYFGDQRTDDIARIEVTATAEGKITLREGDRIYVKLPDGKATWGDVDAVGMESFFAFLQLPPSGERIVFPFSDTSWFLASTPNNRYLMEKTRKTCINGICNEPESYLLSKDQSGKPLLLKVGGINPLHPERGVLVVPPPYLDHVERQVLGIEEALPMSAALEGRRVAAISAENARLQCGKFELSFFAGDIAKCELLYRLGPHIKAASRVCAETGQIPDVDAGFMQFDPTPGLLEGQIVKIAFKCKEPSESRSEPKSK